MTIVLIVLVIMVISFYYKAYLDCKIKNPENSISIISIIAFRRYGFMSLFPNSLISKNENERKLRIRSNRAIFVFYTCFIIILYLSLF